MSPAAQARWVLFTAFVVLLFNSGSRFALSVMLLPMSEDLGWSRTTLSTTVTLFMVVSALSLPLAGRLVDRWGARTVLALGITVSGVSLALMGHVRHPFEAYFLYGVVFALGSATTSITPIGVMLERWYPERAGMANSIAISGMGVGQLLIVSALASQLMFIGWRGSYLLLGLVVLVGVLPLVILTGRGRPSARAPAHAHSSAPSAPGASPSALRPVLTSRGFLALGTMYVICGFQDFLVATHIVALATDQGLSPFLAGNMLALMGLAGLIGVLATGALNDRYGPRLPTAICFVIRIALFGLIVVSRSPALIAVAALAYGFTFWITAPLTVIFARALAPLAMLGTVTGLITMLHHAAGGFGAFVGARAFDTTGSYDAAIALALVLSVVALSLTPLVPKLTAATR